MTSVTWRHLENQTKIKERDVLKVTDVCNEAEEELHFTEFKSK